MRTAVLADLLSRSRVATLEAPGLRIVREVRCFDLPGRDPLALVRTELSTGGLVGGLEARRTVESDGVRLVSEMRLIGPLLSPFRAWLRERLEDSAEVEETGWRAIEPAAALEEIGLALMLDPLGSLVAAGGQDDGQDDSQDGERGARTFNDGTRTLVRFRSDVHIDGAGAGGIARVTAEVSRDEPAVLTIWGRGLAGPIAFELFQQSRVAGPTAIVDPSPDQIESVRRSPA